MQHKSEVAYFNFLNQLTWNETLATVSSGVFWHAKSENSCGNDYHLFIYPA